jgi:putative polyhydroxyalkanoate system protein
MADIHIHRDHRLGLARARKVAAQWAAQAEAEFGMACTVVTGAESDTLEFTGSGVNGALVVAADHYTLDAKLGFLLGAFSTKIEAEIGKNLDALLASNGVDEAYAKPRDARRVIENERVVAKAGAPRTARKG